MFHAILSVICVSHAYLYLCLNNNNNIKEKRDTDAFNEKQVSHIFCDDGRRNIIMSLKARDGFFT